MTLTRIASKSDPASERESGRQIFLPNVRAVLRAALAWKGQGRPKAATTPGRIR
jgi:CRISPR/Cas system endoribonuclease Cas6 (RAMP superfamily)